MEEKDISKLDVEKLYKTFIEILEEEYQVNIEYKIVDVSEKKQKTKEVTS